MQGIDSVVKSAEKLLEIKGRPAIIVRAEITREITPRHPDDSQVEIEYSFNSKVPAPIRTYVLLERGQQINGAEILKNSLDYLVDRLGEKGISAIPSSELNALPLSEISRKHGLDTDVRLQIYKYTHKRKIPFKEGEAVLYRKNAPAPVLGQMKLL
ncbi:MAG: hypothetical protein V1702_04625 [Candidatus Woesearchaeota archaeon]